MKCWNRPKPNIYIIKVRSNELQCWLPCHYWNLGSFLRQKEKIKKEKNLDMFMLLKCSKHRPMLRFWCAHRLGWGCALWHADQMLYRSSMWPGPLLLNQLSTTASVFLPLPCIALQQCPRSPFLGYATQTLWKHLSLDWELTALQWLRIWAQRKTRMNKVAMIV